MDFHCPHRPECKGDDVPNFVEAQEAFVGTEYERHRKGIPRLLFVSIDPGGSPADPNERTMAAERLRVEEGKDAVKNIPPSKYNQHWYQTNLLAFELLGNYRPSEITLDNVSSYFAHTRAAKCCANYEGFGEGPGRLFKNCESYLDGEIKALKPDVVISQGDRGMDAVMSVLGRFKFCDSNFYYKDDAIQDWGKVIFFRQYHPAAYGLFWPQKDFWPKWQSILHEGWPVPALAA
jgi:hypothetical protein